MSKLDKQYTDLTNYLLKQQAWAKDAIRQHTTRILATADSSDDDDAGHAVVDLVGSTESLFEAAAWLNVVSVIRRRRGATLAEVRDFIDGQLQHSSRTLVNSTSPTHNLARIYQVMVWSKLIDRFNLEGWGIR